MGYYIRLICCVSAVGILICNCYVQSSLSLAPLIFINLSDYIFTISITYYGGGRSCLYYWYPSSRISRWTFQTTFTGFVCIGCWLSYVQSSTLRFPAIHPLFYEHSFPWTEPFFKNPLLRSWVSVPFILIAMHCFPSSKYFSRLLLYTLCRYVRLFFALKGDLKNARNSPGLNLSE